MAIKVNKIDLLEERSELGQEIMTKKPVWIVRFGTTLFFSIIVTLIVISWMIKFPDIISAPIYLTTTESPVKLYSKSDGNIQILVNANSHVQANEHLAYIKNSGDYSQILFLRGYLSEIETPMLEMDSSIAALRELNKLGEKIQPIFQQFIIALENFQYQIQQSPYQKEVSAIKNQLGEAEIFLDQKKNQLELIQEEYQIVERDHTRNVSLHKESVISERDFDESKKNLIRAKNDEESIKSQIMDIRLRISTLKATIVQLGNTEKKNKMELKQRIYSTYGSLLNELTVWEQLYIIKSPINGKLEVHEKWTDNQYVSPGKHIYTVIPDANSRYIGIVQSPVQNSGKVKTGQKVNILLDDYPYSEFGVVEGVVQNISLMPKEKSYMIRISLRDSSLVSSYGKSLNFKPEMTGTAEIITENLRLLERLFYQFRSILVKSGDVDH